MSPFLMPIFAMVVVTGCVWLAMLAQRAGHMHKHALKPQDMPTRALADAKFGDAQSANNALMNLFELLVLFYMLCVLMIVLNRNDGMMLGMAWIYAGLRAVQGAIHVTYNNVLQRGFAYLASCAVLWLMWARLGWLVWT